MRAWLTGPEALALAGVTGDELEPDLLSGAVWNRVYVAGGPMMFRNYPHMGLIIDWPASTLRFVPSDKPMRFEIHRPTLLAIYGEPADGATTAGAAHAEPKNAGGRPRKWDWDAFWCEVAARVYEEGLPETPAELVTDMLDWFITKYDGHPHKDNVSKRVNEVYRRVGR